MYYGDEQKLLECCPFYNHKDNESTIGRELFGEMKNINYNEYEGYYIKNFAGHVKVNNFRKVSTSGGITTWLASTLLKEKIVDAVIHVKPSKKNKLLFEYQISNNLDEIIEGATSKYYPVEMSKVLNYVRENKKRYLFVGVPCFVKAIRLFKRLIKL